MIRPFSYQKACLIQLAKARKKGKKRALVVMATGLGKTITVALDVNVWLKDNPNGRVLYVCHQNDILRQARTTFEAVIDGNPNHYGYYHGLAKESHSQILFASFQTMKGHLKNFGHRDFGYIVIDESHHTHAETYRPVVEYFCPDFLVGVTATPDRADLQDIREVFGKEVFSLGLPEALAKGFLAPVDYRLVTDELIELGKIENPFRLTVKELNKRIFVPKRDEEIALNIRKRTAHLKNPRTMVFCSSIKHAERFHAYMPGSITVHSGLSRSEQQVRLEAFRNGLSPVAITVDKFNEGIDVPQVEVVVFLRSTQSNTVFYQQLGRGLRKLRGKKKVLVLDFVANCDRVETVYALSQAVREAEKKKGSKRRSSTRHGAKEVHFKDFNFVFTEKAKDILEILHKRRFGFYPTWQEASMALRKLGPCKSKAEYRKKYKEDPRLPSVPENEYPNYPGDSMFLRGENKIEKYSTWQKASKAAQRLGIRTSTEYVRHFKKDPRLVRLPSVSYPDFPGYPIFLGRKKRPPIYKNLIQAQTAARRLGFKSVGQYKDGYKKDPRLPCAPDKRYNNFPGWTSFLGTRKNFYPSWQVAARAIKRFHYPNQGEYHRHYKKDSRLPSNPQSWYTDFPGWDIFLRGERRYPNAPS